MATSTSKNFKATYLRVLTQGTPTKADYWAARELIDKGHATGKCQIDRSRDDYGEVITLLAFAPTVSGRLLADQIADQLHKRSLRYRLVQALIGGVSFGGGWVAGVLSQVTASGLLKWAGIT